MNISDTLRSMKTGEMSLKFAGRLVVLVLAAVMIGCAQREKIAVREVAFAPTEAGVVKVMTYNIRYDTGSGDPNGWNRRKEPVFDQIAEHAADVVALQEVLDSQLQTLQKALPQYKVVAVGRDDGDKDGEACAVLYRADRFELDETETFWFSNMPWKPGSKHWGNTVPRICTWVRLTEIQTGERFYVYNLHLDHQSQSSRKYSVDLLARQVANRADRDAVIVLGDFNMDTNNPAMAPICGNKSRIRLVDVWGYLHPEQPSITTYQGFGSQPDGPCLDHILIDPKIQIIEAAIDARSFDGRYPSDHFPVIAVLKVFQAE